MFLWLQVFFAQSDRKITGTIFSETTKLPLANANVKTRNLGFATTSTIDGQFSLLIKYAGNDAIFIEITSVGYEKKTLRLGVQSNYKIFLNDDYNSLEEIIVTSSYGTKKRKEETVGSLVTVKAADLQVQQTAESFDKMLDGLAAGVLVTGTSALGAPVKINIRGQGSLTPLNGNIIGTSTQPLFIIDGVIMSEEKGVDNELFDGSGTFTEQFKNPLAKISPEDIESITILKDAAAVGVYGADAANGVILVVTKRSKSKKLDVNFSTQTGFSTPINQIKFLSGPQYFELKKEYNFSQGQSIAQAINNAGSNTINTNWFDLTSRDGSFQRYNVSAGFGVKNWNFRASLNTFFNEEASINNNYKRYGGNLNFGYNNEKFNFQLTLSPSLTVQNAPNTLANFPLLPNISPFNADGSIALTGFTGFGNPLAYATQNTNQTRNISSVGSLNMSYLITKKLKISTLFGIDFTNKDQIRFLSGENESGRANGTFSVRNSDGTISIYNNWGRRLDYFRDATRWNQSTQLTYETKVKKHNFDGLLGLELQREKVNNSRESGLGYIDFVTFNTPQNANGRYNFNSFMSEEAKRSVFSQFNYNYDKKYFILFNLRRDESSVFGSDVNAALNGGVGASWNINSEKFLVKTAWIDFLRLRASFGSTGNSRIGSSRSLGLYNQDISGFDGYNGNPFASPITAPNNNLSWEKNYKGNIGIDFNFFNRFKTTLEFFRDNITDIIVNRAIPPETGFTRLEINGSSMQNQGIEFSIQTTWFKNKNFGWSTNLNFTKIENKVTELFGLGDAFSIAARAAAQKVGFSTSAIWGIQYAGIDPANGRELYKNKGQIYDAATYSNLFNESDWEIIGDRNPAFYGGIQNNFTILNSFTVNVRAAYRYGGDELIEPGFTNYRQILNKNLSVNVLDRWRNQGDIVNNPVVSDRNPLFSNSSKFLHDTSHIKIQNINLSYQLPVRKINMKFFDAASFSCDVSNVAYFYKEKSVKGRNGIAEYANAYPESRTLTFGFQANF